MNPELINEYVSHVPNEICKSIVLFFKTSFFLIYEHIIK
jgi:hypothetical protein